jgi:hypothetical protein
LRNSCHLHDVFILVWWKRRGIVAAGASSDGDVATQTGEAAAVMPLELNLNLSSLSLLLSHEMARELGLLHTHHLSLPCSPSS